MQEIVYGSFEGEPIVWLILEDDENTQLLISKFCLDAHPFNDEAKPVVWADCTLRAWLNTDFYNQAFSIVEKSNILEVENINEGNSRFNSNYSQSTKDKVWILSISEAEKYFDCMSSRMAPPTEYAKKKGIYMSWDHPWWWLRTPGNYPNIAAEVYYDGYIDYLGHMVNFENDGVRPVIRIKKQH